MKIIIKTSLFLFLALSLSTVAYAQGSYASQDKDHNKYRRGASIAESQAFLISQVWPEIMKNYHPGSPSGCGKYEFIGICLNLALFTSKPRIKPMWSYYVPFQLTEHSNRPGASRLTPKTITKLELELARAKLDSVGVNIAVSNAQLLKLQDPKIKVPKKGSKDVKEIIKPHHRDDNDFGDQDVGPRAQTPIYSSLHDSGWHNFARNLPQYKSIESPFTWCHEYTHESMDRRKTGPKPLVPRFSDLGARAVLYTFFRIMTYQNQDLAKLTLKPDEVQNCAGKREKSRKYPAENYDILRKHNQIGDEQDSIKCPGDGFMDEMNFTRLTNSLYRAFTSLGKSSSIIFKAWYLETERQKDRHHLKVNDDHRDERGKPHHNQIIWPDPDSSDPAWRGGCRDRFVEKREGEQSHYSVPKYDLPTDYIKASRYLDRNYDLFTFAHYVNVSCCPKSYIPIRFRSGYETRKLR